MRFSLWQLMKVVTICCVCFALTVATHRAMEAEQVRTGSTIPEWCLWLMPGFDYFGFWFMGWSIWRDYYYRSPDHFIGEGI